MLYALSAVIALTVLFIVLHLRPLKQDEVKILSGKRRNKAIEAYFAFRNVQFIADRDAKKAMPPAGGYFYVDWELSDAPPMVAGLLKHKKHEWIIFAFEKARKVEKLWMNKGFDKQRVAHSVSIESVRRMCVDSGYSSVQVLHNHPNPEGFRTGASTADLSSANSWATILNEANVTLVEYVCDRGTPIRYFLKAPDTFLPLTEFEQGINATNGLSWRKNFSLHFERIF